jgi:lysophospholipid acyltransferase (LPLAT)-like uncharacterized protein
MSSVAPQPNKKSAIKGGKKEKVLGTIAGWLIRLLSLTLRIEFRNDEYFQKINGAVILVFWHGHIIPAIAAWFRKCPRPHGLSALTSASRDGAIIEHTLRVYGISAVRGSTSRRGTTALRELKKTLDSGSDICITPDGPRGPARVLQGGPLKLSQLTGCALLPLRVVCSSSWKLKTWDSFEIPKPFSKIYLCIDTPLFVPRDFSAEELEALRLNLEKELSQPPVIH